MSTIIQANQDFLAHYGMPRRSGRYPWGSGDRPYQGEKVKKYLEPSIKSGKDKPNVSPAEKTIRDVGKVIDESRKAIREVKDMKKSKPDSSVKQMTDSELRSIINRLNMEKQYSDLTSKEVTTGLDYASNILEIAGSVTAIAASVTAILSTIYMMKNK